MKNQTKEQLMSRQREINSKLGEIYSQVENREMNDAEKNQVETLKREYENNQREISLSIQEAQVREISGAKEKKTLVREICDALKEGKRSITVNGYTDAQSQQVPGVHGHVVETEIQGILEPLYAESVLSKLGVRMYEGLPQGDIQIPVMGKGTVGWAGEIAAAGESTNTFTHKTLTPKRLSAYVDISRQLLVQDTKGVEAAIRRDIVTALREKLEATIFGDAAGSTTQPAGIFNGQSIPTATTTFAALTDLEAGVEEANVTGNMKYLLSPKAKADLRAMSKSSKNTQLVMEGGNIDGVPALVTSNVNPNTPASFVYGDFNFMAIGSWGNIDITIDEYTQAVNGCVRLVVNAYFDAVILRPEAFAFGKTR